MKRAGLMTVLLAGMLLVGGCCSMCGKDKGCCQKCGTAAGESAK